jgi:hypothetical protein
LDLINIFFTFGEKFNSMVNIAGNEIPNTVDELTVGQFDRLNEINISELDSIDKWIAKFVFLGVPEEAFDEMTLEEFKQVVAEFNSGDEVTEDRTLTVNIDGFDYSTKESIGAKDLSLIEKAWKLDRSDFSAECLAILFKRDDLGRTEHYSASHIKHKRALFKKLPCRFAIPHVVEVSRLLVKSIEKSNASEVVE